MARLLIAKGDRTLDDNKLQIFDNGNGKVVYLYNGKNLFNTDVPWEVADQIAKKSTRAARLAEEVCKANQVIMDNALLQRSGVLPGIGLSDHPLIKAESIKEALHNTKLRRYLPYQKPNVDSGMGAIKRRGVVGAPSLVKRNGSSQL